MSTQSGANSARRLILDSVSKTYDSYLVLKDVTFEAKGGDFVAIVGPSGSGKTTLLGIIGGLEKPSSGRVVFEGEELANLDDSRLARYRNKCIGFVHQAFNLLPYLTASENIMVPMIIAGNKPSFALTRSLELLDFVGLKHKAMMLPRQMSGGEQQRIAVARALGNEPDIILADEPTANLDEVNAQVIMEYLHTLTESGKTVILATHDRELAQQAARKYVIGEGAFHEV
jgi:putative ABC transport system ATP-binding protein